MVGGGGGLVLLVRSIGFVLFDLAFKFRLNNMLTLAGFELGQAWLGIGWLFSVGFVSLGSALGLVSVG